MFLFWCKKLVQKDVLYIKKIPRKNAIFKANQENAATGSDLDASWLASAACTNCE